MQAFEYLGVLISVVIGLALTHLVVGVVAVIQSRQSAKLYWVHLLWTFNVLFWLLQFWWFFYSWQALTEWSAGMFYLFVAYALCLSIIAGLLFPVRGSVTDFCEFYFEHARWLFATLVIVNLIDIVEVMSKANAGIRPVPPEYIPYVSFVIIASLIAAITKNRHYHAFFAVAFFVFSAGYEFVIFSPIGN